MEGQEILANLRRAWQNLMRRRLVVNSPRERVADVPLVYGVLLVLCTPVACAVAFVLGLARHYTLHVEQSLERRT